MKSRVFISFFFVLISCFQAIAQKDKNETTREKVSEDVNVVIVDSISTKSPTINPLAPSKAAFYSAILPGLGQAYNKKYWKVPIAIGAVTGGILFYDYYNDLYNNYRDAYKRRLAGFTDDEYYGRVSDDGLIRAQKTLRRSKELTLIITIGIYVLNIIDANVDAHLQQFNVDERLSLQPVYERNQIDGNNNFGLSFNFKF